MTFATGLLKNRFLSSLERISHGRLTLTTPEGAVLRFGSAGPEADLEVRDWSFLPRLARRGDVGLGESWIDRQWETASLENVLALALKNMDHLAPWAKAGRLPGWAMRFSDRVSRMNSLGGSARNIRAHYDVGNEFYQLWLDRGMSYSSALFAPGDDDLERAQTRKNDRILSRLTAGETVLEIGCGWGSFAEAAAMRGRRVKAITISPSQSAYADARLDGRAEIRLQDYRHTAGRFDNIVSVEMIEAVGERYWPTYFATLKARLADDGRAILQAITVPDASFPAYRKRSDFIRQHAFPGGMLPCRAAIAAQAARAGLTLSDSFAFGQDYARTCRLWAGRMMAERPRIFRFGYDDAFLRSWQFYLEGCAATFATGRTDVVQVELTHAEGPA